MMNLTTLIDIFSFVSFCCDARCFSIENEGCSLHWYSHQIYLILDLDVDVVPDVVVVGGGGGMCGFVW
jgi:hypothetical protein